MIGLVVKRGVRLLVLGTLLLFVCRKVVDSSCCASGV